MGLGQLIPGTYLDALYLFASDGTDSSGNTRTLTVANSPTFSQQRFSGGVDMGTTGVNKRISADISPTPNYTDAFMAGFWFKLNTLSTQNGRGFVLQRSSGGNGSRFVMTFDSPGSTLEVYCSATTQGVSPYTSVIITADLNWHWATFYYDGINQVAVTVDGGKRSTSTNGTSIAFDPGVNTTCLFNNVSSDEGIWMSFSEMWIRSTTTFSDSMASRHYTQAKGRHCI